MRKLNSNCLASDYDEFKLDKLTEVDYVSL